MFPEESLETIRNGEKRMNEAYYEIMVSKKASPLVKVAQIVAAIMSGFFVLIMFMGIIWGIVLAVAFGVASYVISLYSSVEYEYLYVDKELQIDCILAKSKRKRKETLDLNELVVLAPVRSHELDHYRNGNYKKADYSSGEEDNAQKKYMLIVNDKQIIFEPTEELVKTIRMFAPRKVFTY